MIELLTVFFTVEVISSFSGSLAEVVASGFMSSESSSPTIIRVSLPDPDLEPEV